MIRSNLAVVLAEQGLRITKVSKDTGISRTTLTALANNQSQGIRFDTLNSLCMYLKVTPNQLISYYPIDIALFDVIIGQSNTEVDIVFRINENTRYPVYPLASLIGYIRNVYVNGVHESYVLDLSLRNYEEDNDQERENEMLKRTFANLPRTFLSDIEHDIVAAISNKLSDYENVPCKILWPQEFVANQ